MRQCIIPGTIYNNSRGHNSLLPTPWQHRFPRPSWAHKYRRLSWTKSRPIATVLSGPPTPFYFSHCTLCNRCACTLHTNASTLEAHERDTRIFARICGLPSCVRAATRHSEWYGMAWRANSSPSINLHLVATVRGQLLNLGRVRISSAVRSFARTLLVCVLLYICKHSKGWFWVWLFAWNCNGEWCSAEYPVVSDLRDTVGFRHEKDGLRFKRAFYAFRFLQFRKI